MEWQPIEQLACRNDARIVLLEDAPMLEVQIKYNQQLVLHPYGIPGQAG
jgi:hypothetical protein